MGDLHFQSSDLRFGLLVPADEFVRMATLCRKARRSESGGVIAGRYNERHDCAMVTEVTGPPVDSRSGRTWFRRGIRGLQQLMERLWKRDRSFYLGEWHYHPYAPPEPSRIDVDQMTHIANEDNYACPEPILLILGGDPGGELGIGVFVFCRGSGCLELTRQGHNPDGGELR